MRILTAPRARAISPSIRSLSWMMSSICFLICSSLFNSSSAFASCKRLSTAESSGESPDVKKLAVTAVVDDTGTVWSGARLPANVPAQSPAAQPVSNANPTSAAPFTFYQYERGLFSSTCVFAMVDFCGLGRGGTPASWGIDACPGHEIPPWMGLSAKLHAAWGKLDSDFLDCVHTAARPYRCR